MAEKTDYRALAMDDAKETVKYFMDQVVEQIREEGKASDDLLNDYPNGDAYHHERHVDKAYTLLEAAELLDQLDEYEETDWGLWQGLEPRRAISAQAAYTYGNAVYGMFTDVVKTINEKVEETGELLVGPKEWVPPRKGRKPKMATITELVEGVLKNA